MPDLRKLNQRGGQWNPTDPFLGLSPILNMVPADQLEADYYEAARWINFTKTAEIAPDVPEEHWFTTEDPEWPTHLFAEVGVDPDPGSVLRPMIIESTWALDCTRVEAAAMIVGMDTCTQVADRIVRWAQSEPGVTLSTRVQLIDDDDDRNDDIIGYGFALPCFILSRITDVMRVLFSEKFRIEAQTLGRGEPGGDLHGKPWGWRPEMITSWLAGLGPGVVTTYGEVGCPAMHEDPEGHSFWAYICGRAALALNGEVDGESTDWHLGQMAEHGPLYRVLAGVHTVRSASRGNEIASRLANHSDEWWRYIDEWPRPVKAP